jgi:hypothetical protein
MVIDIPENITLWITREDLENTCVAHKQIDLEDLVINKDKIFAISAVSLIDGEVCQTFLYNK